MWDPRGRGKGGDLLAFADTEGYVGVFEKVYPSSEGGGGGGGVEGVESDPLVDDSLLMEVCISHIPLSASDQVIAATNDHTSSLPSPSPALSPPPPQGIPADDIFNDDYNIEDDIMDTAGSGYHGNQAGGGEEEGEEGEEDDDISHIRKRRRVEEEEEGEGVTGEDLGTKSSQ